MFHVRVWEVKRVIDRNIEGERRAQGREKIVREKKSWDRERERGGGRGRTRRSEKIEHIHNEHVSVAKRRKKLLQTTNTSDKVTYQYFNSYYGLLGHWIYKHFNCMFMLLTSFALGKGSNKNPSSLISPFLPLHFLFFTSVFLPNRFVAMIRFTRLGPTSKWRKKCKSADSFFSIQFNFA